MRSAEPTISPKNGKVIRPTYAEIAIEVLPSTALSICPSKEKSRYHAAFRPHADRGAVRSGEAAHFFPAFTAAPRVR